METASADTLLLLPGLDGTGRLFSSLIDELRHDFDPRPVAYPPDRLLDLDALAEHARGFVPPGSRYAIVAESFSGPIALKLAATDPRGLTALILVATFVSPPLSQFSGVCLRAGATIGVRTPLLRGSAARWLAEGSAAMAAEVRAAIASVQPSVVADRLRMLTRIDARRELALCKVPILYLAGARDRLVTGSNARELSRLRPDITFRQLPSGHLVLQTQPKLAAEEIVRFVQNANSLERDSRLVGHS